MSSVVYDNERPLLHATAVHEIHDLLLKSRVGRVIIGERQSRHLILVQNLEALAQSPYFILGMNIVLGPEYTEDVHFIILLPIFEV